MVEGWLNGDNDPFFDYLFNSEKSDNSEERLNTSGDHSVVSHDEKMCVHDEVRTHYVGEVRRWVDSAIVTNFDGSKSVNLRLRHLRGIMWTSESLRIIADYLDELNIQWEYNLSEYFDDYAFGLQLQLDDD